MAHSVGLSISNWVRNISVSLTLR